MSNPGTAAAGCGLKVALERLGERVGSCRRSSPSSSVGYVSTHTTRPERSRSAASVTTSPPIEWPTRTTRSTASASTAMWMCHRRRPALSTRRAHRSPWLVVTTEMAGGERPHPALARAGSPRPAVDEDDGRRNRRRRTGSRYRRARWPCGSSASMGGRHSARSRLSRTRCRGPRPLERDQPVVLGVAVDAADDRLVTGLGHVVQEPAGDAPRLGQADARARPPRADARHRTRGRPTCTPRRSRRAPTGPRRRWRPRHPADGAAERPDREHAPCPAASSATWSTRARRAGPSRTHSWCRSGGPRPWPRRRRAARPSVEAPRQRLAERQQRRHARSSPRAHPGQRQDRHRLADHRLRDAVGCLGLANHHRREEVVRRGRRELGGTRDCDVAGARREVRLTRADRDQVECCYDAELWGRPRHRPRTAPVLVGADRTCRPSAETSSTARRQSMAGRACAGGARMPAAERQAGDPRVRDVPLLHARPTACAASSSSPQDRAAVASRDPPLGSTSRRPSPRGR